MPTLLSIAGLDPTGGAGLLADVAVCHDHDLRCLGVVTATTVQDTRGVHDAQPLAADMVEKQIEKLLGDVAVDVVKIGMLGDHHVAQGVARALRRVEAPIVWDPVFLPSRGGTPLLTGDRKAAARALLPICTLITPNLSEATALSGVHVENVATMRRAAAALRAEGARAVLVKGGHLSGSRAIDVLYDGDLVTVFDELRVDTGPVHGTGCVLSAAIACELAYGTRLSEAVRRSKVYLTDKLKNLLTVGRGARCLV